MFKNQHNTTLYVKIVSLGHRLVHHYEPINLTIKPLKSENFSGFFMFKQFIFSLGLSQTKISAESGGSEVQRQRKRMFPVACAAWHWSTPVTWAEAFGVKPADKRPGISGYPELIQKQQPVRRGACLPLA